MHYLNHFFPLPIAIQQLKVESKYWYKIIVNNVIEVEEENNNPLTFPDVHLYTSNSFPQYKSFTPEVGNVCNLKILQGGGEL